MYVDIIIIIIYIEYDVLTHRPFCDYFFVKNIKLGSY